MSKSIIKSSIFVTLFTIFVKAFGLIKNTVFASIIGSNIHTDAYYIATGVIGQLTIIIFSSLSISLLSMYADKNEKFGSKEANKLINDALMFFIPIAFVVTTLCFLFSPVIAKLLAPSYSSSQLIELIKYIKIMSFTAIPCCYHIILNVVLEKENVFIPGRCRGLFQNLCVILGAIFLYKLFGVEILVYCFLFSNIIQSVVVTIFASKYFDFKITKFKITSEMKKLLYISIPLIIGNAVYEINDIVDKQIATGLGAGFTSNLTYGATLNEIVTGVIVSSVSVVLFSNFATWVSKKQVNKIEKWFILVSDILTMILVPIMVIFIFSGKEITTLFYGNGILQTNDLSNIYFVLIGYSIGFIFQAFRSNLIKILYAFQDTKITMINGVMSIAINVCLSLILTKYFGIIGISLATSISIFIATILLFISVKKYIPTLKIKNIVSGYYKYVISGIAAAIIILIYKHFFSFNNFINLLVESLSSLTIYFCLLYLLKCKSLYEVINLLKNHKKQIRIK